mmetsp:Transcript_138529/g.244731  ORF Transcript_138529/g.244731 Transcript_138529/m.244731 type:complete len:464 (+) Transcript_138529:72-1463(+)
MMSPAMCALVLVAALVTAEGAPARPLKQIVRVRREIRTLPQEQWDAVIRALNIMKTTSQEEGQAKYGSDFMNYDRFVVKHAHCAMHPRCDQGHYGPAFLTYHRTITLLMENSLLAIDPKVEALPYWDYNLDLEKYGDPRDSEVWTDRFLGENQGDPKDSWMIRNGPFKEWRVRANLSAFAPEVANPYNMLRGPTNMQYAPRLTRSSSICGVHTNTTFSIANWTTCLTKPKAFSDFLNCIDAGMGGVHSFAHRWLGGAWGASDGYCAKKQDNPSIADRMSGCMVCPQCKAGEACRCHRNETACAQASASGMCQRRPGGEHHPWDPKGPCLTCPECIDGELGAAGDFWDAATSPNDPVFWFHHPNVDRLLMEWQLRWKDAPQTPLPHSGYPESGHCGGHNLHDVMSESDPFHGSLLGWTGNAALLPLRNQDILEATVPLQNSPYTYDTLMDERKRTILPLGTVVV